MEISRTSFDRPSGQAIEMCQLSLPQSRNLQFDVGDKVKVLVDVERLEVLQKGHGGWNPQMADFIGKLGTVQRILKKREVKVKYEGYPNIWTFHPGVLTKVDSQSHPISLRNVSPIGEMLRIIDNPELGKEFHIGEGFDFMEEWVTWNTMLTKYNHTQALGKMVKMSRPSEGNSRVIVDGQMWTFKEENILCKFILQLLFLLKLVEITVFTQLDHQLSKQEEKISNDKLVKESAQGHKEVVCDILCKFPEMVDQKSSGKTALQVACLQGHLDIVCHLLAVGSNTNIQDDDGDTALHYAAFGNQPEVIEQLLKKQAALNAVNKAKWSALHIAVKTQHIQCVKVLLKYRCNVNNQDSYGNTALHYAIRKGDIEIIELLAKVSGLDFSLKNKRGFSILHQAALKGNNKLQKFRAALVRVQIEKKLDCLNCYEFPANITFEPCGHTITCLECCQRMKKCSMCQELILKKTGPAGRPIPSKVAEAGAEKLHFLECQIREFEEAHCCSICLERRRSVAFLCGHGACAECSRTLKICHMCREPITNRITLYD